jgi:diguanylate cyclase (GGDEF)-like protein/PAS domain S-box-containing protein
MVVSHHIATGRNIGLERTRLWTSLLDQNTEGIVVCDPRVRIVIVNAAFERITGFSEMESIGRTPRILRSKRQDRAFYVQMWQVINASGHWNGEIWNRRKDGEVYPQWLNINAVCDRPGHVTHYVGTYSDITQRKAVEAQTKHLFEHDALTGLPNGSLLIQRLQELAAISRGARAKTAVLFVDLDRFNNINDSMGRRAGDQLLQTVSRRIGSAVRHSDFVARLGADEFVVLLPELHQPSDASDVARAILDAIYQPTTLAGQQLVICASVGICIFPDDGAEPEELIRNAGAAMYRAKREGRNSFQFYTREMNEGAAESLRTETALRLALEREELVLHYQPQVDLASGAIVGAEALARWNRPGVGLLNPAQFIPIAEERGLMAQLGRYVLGKAIRQIKEWDVRGLAPIAVAVNVSASEFHQPGFVDHLAAEIHRHAIDPGRLELELTEGVALGNAAATIETLRRLHSLGVRLSLDDFGTGYSSLGYLGRLPIDRIKIDKSFIGAMTAKPESIQVVRAIIALARSFALKVIAEGVESVEQLATLRNEGCDEIQGYLAGVPVPPEEFATLLRTWESEGRINRTAARPSGKRGARNVAPQ